MSIKSATKWWVILLFGLLIAHQFDIDQSIKNLKSDLFDLQQKIH